MGEVKGCLQGFSDLRMIYELFAIISGDGMDPVRKRAQQRDHRLRNQICQALIHRLHQGEARFSFFP